MARGRSRKDKNRKGWGLFASFLFLFGFLGIHTLLFKNFVLEPMGLMEQVNVLFISLSPGEIVLNVFNFVWGATIWHSFKQVVL